MISFIKQVLTHHCSEQIFQNICTNIMPRLYSGKTILCCFSQLLVCFLCNSFILLFGMKTWMLKKSKNKNQVQLFNKHFLQCTTTSPPPPLLLLPLGWNSSRITACALFIPILCLLRHLAIAPPPSPPCPLPALPSSPSLIGPDIDGSWMLANDCLWSHLIHPLLTLRAITHRLD